MMKEAIGKVLIGSITVAFLVIAALLAALLHKMDFWRCLTIVNFGAVAACAAIVAATALDRMEWK